MKAVGTRWAFPAFVAASLIAVAVAALPFLPGGVEVPGTPAESTAGPLPAHLSNTPLESGRPGPAEPDLARPAPSTNWTSFSLATPPGAASATAPPPPAPPLAPVRAATASRWRPGGVSPSAPLALRV